MTPEETLSVLIDSVFGDTIDDVTLSLLVEATLNDLTGSQP